MKYITIVAKDFEEALSKARAQYGSALRVHSRRDVMARGGFLWLSRRTHVELTCYLVDEVPVETPQVVEPLVSEPEINNEIPIEQEPLQDPLHHEQLIDHAGALLKENDFSPRFIDSILELIRDALEVYGNDEPTIEEFELMVVDKIVSLIAIDHETQLNPPHVFVLLGPTGIGKTTTIAKIAALYGLQRDPVFRRSVQMISIDSFRAGAFEQLSAFGSSLDIPVLQVESESDFHYVLQQGQDTDVLLVDTIGRSPRDNDLAVKMKTLLSVPDVAQRGCYLAVSGAMKSADVLKSMDQYGSFGIRSVIITKMDETETVGNVLSACHERDLPILFFTDGQRVPKDIHKASAATMLGNLRGFSLDFQNLWVNQTMVEQLPLG